MKNKFSTYYELIIWVMIVNSFISMISHRVLVNEVDSIRDNLNWQAEFNGRIMSGQIINGVSDEQSESDGDHARVSRWVKEEPES